MVVTVTQRRVTVSVLLASLVRGGSSKKSLKLHGAWSSASVVLHAPVIGYSNTYCFWGYMYGRSKYVCNHLSILTCCHSTGVMKSVQWGAMGRTVRVCVTALMVHDAITYTVAVCVSRASVDPSVHIGCAQMEPSACTVNRAASVTPNTLSGDN